MAVEAMMVVAEMMMAESAADGCGRELGEAQRRGAMRASANVLNMTVSCSCAALCAADGVELISKRLAC